MDGLISRTPGIFPAVGVSTMDERGQDMADSAAVLDIVRLVTDHHQALYRYAYRLTGSTADAEDLTQQVFLVAHERLNQLRDVERVRAWLFAILRNCYLKSHRSRQPLTAGSIDFDIDSVADQQIDEPIDGEQLQAALDALPDEFKIVVLMFYFEFCSYRVIAERLEIPVGTVMSRLARAKAQLRRKLCDAAERAGTSRRELRGSSRLVQPAPLGY
jgi:RNA polymerase sigma-70 factor (ECF subfamily)